MTQFNNGYQYHKGFNFLVNTVIMINDRLGRT